MSTKHLVIGWDGAGLDLIQSLGPERLPHVHQLMARGSFAPLESIPPSATLPNWISFLTAVAPGWHGVFDFTTRHDYAIRFDGAKQRKAETFFQSLDQQGLRCAVLGFPGTFPPERLERGIFISGWDSPVAFESDARFVWPRHLFSELRQRFGPWRFDDVDEFAEHNDGWLEKLIEQLKQRAIYKTNVYCDLLQREAWDVFACYFGESDTAAHHLWSLHDPKSPRRPEQVSPSQSLGLSTIYEQLDQSLGALLSVAGQDVEVTLVSDHGSGGSSDKVFFLNRFLAEAGFLSFKKPMLGRTSVALKQAALRFTPQRLKQKAFKAYSGFLPNFLESKVRFGSIDFSNTVVFSDELNYFPALYFNIAGRESQGIVKQSELSALKHQIESALLALRDPWTDRAIVRAVHDRETLFRGPYVTRAPDLVLELALDGDYSYNLMPSVGAQHVFRRLNRSEYLGRKGRSLAGSHRNQGLWVGAGPSVESLGMIKAHMLDASVTMLARMNAQAPKESEGTVLPCLRNREQSEHQLALQNRKITSQDDEKLVSQRLRALGYID